MLSNHRLRQTARRAALLLAIAGLILTLLLAAAGWYYSNLLRSGGFAPDYSEPDLNLVVVAVEGDRITLAPREGNDLDDLQDDELWGLETSAGYGQVSEILAMEGARVTRAFRLLSGEVRAGDLARLDSFAFDGDPKTARGLDFTQVDVTGPLGALPAWRLEGARNTWVILVHGWRSDRQEALRILPTLADLDVTSLVILYRNDEGAPRSPDGLIRWGATEWEDLEAAVQYARSEGAESVVLYGYSMGGGICMRFLQQSAHAGIVSAAILDSPVLDFDDLLAFQADRRGAPGFLAAIGKWFAGWRFDMDWAAMDHLSHLERLRAPILLFHAGDDERAPIISSDRLAAQRPDIVTYHVVPTAGHVREWNVDPGSYEATVRDFVSEVMAKHEQ